MFERDAGRVKAARLLRLLLLLQVQGPTTAPKLAAVLGVSVRTVHRDLAALSEAGVPVYTERGAAGGCRLLEGYRTSLTRLTAAETAAVALAGLPDVAADLGLDALVLSAQLKLLSSLPASVRDAAALTKERFHLDAPGWFRTRMPDHPQLGVVADALWRDSRIVVNYYRADRTSSERRLDPLGLVLKAGLWYLVARTDEGQIRSYRVSRIGSVVDLGEGFARPAGFDLSTFWRTWAIDFERSRSQGCRLVLRVRPEEVSRLEDLESGPAADVAITTDEDGWLRVAIDCETVGFARGAVLGLGDAVEVLEPAGLRAEMAALARGLHAIYKPHTRSRKQDRN